MNIITIAVAAVDTVVASRWLASVIPTTRSINTTVRTLANAAIFSATFTTAFTLLRLTSSPSELILFIACFGAADYFIPLYHQK